MCIKELCEFWSGSDCMQTECIAKQEETSKSEKKTVKKSE